jgi:hypothetical protein
MRELRVEDECRAAVLPSAHFEVLRERVARLEIVAEEHIAGGLERGQGERVGARRTRHEARRRRRRGDGRSGSLSGGKR